MVIEHEGRLRVTAIGDTFSTVAVDSGRVNVPTYPDVVRVGPAEQASNNAEKINCTLLSGGTTP